MVAHLATGRKSNERQRLRLQAQSVGRARPPRGRATDGRPRRDDREHRAPLGAAGPALLGHQPPVGRHRLRARIRQPAPAGRKARRSVRAQVDADRRPRRLRRCIGDRRDGAVLRHARGRPRAAGRVRRDPRPLGAGSSDRHLPGLPRPPQGVRHLRRDRGRRRIARPAARRRAHPDHLLALEPVRQPPDRNPRGARRVSPGQQRALVLARADRRPGRPRRVRRPVRRRVRILKRRDALVVRLRSRSSRSRPAPCC